MEDMDDDEEEERWVLLFLLLLVLDCWILFVGISEVVPIEEEDDGWREWREDVEEDRLYGWDWGDARAMVVTLQMKKAKTIEQCKREWTKQYCRVKSRMMF